MSGKVAVGCVSAALSACGTLESMWVVDRVVEGRAVLIAPSGATRTVAASELPRNAAEGDVLVDGRIDPTERTRLEREIERLRARLRVEGAGKNLDLTAP